MKIFELKRICKNHGTVFTDAELISSAFKTATLFETWENWLNQSIRELSQNELTKIATAARSLLLPLPKDVVALKIGTITPEQCASSSLETAIPIPRQFILFIVDNAHHLVAKGNL